MGRYDPRDRGYAPRDPYNWLYDCAVKWLECADEIEGGKEFDEYPLILTSHLYLVASYLYYVRDNPIFSDRSFDKLCGHLMLNYGRLSAAGVRNVSHLFNQSELSAGSGFVSASRVSEIYIDIAKQIEELLHERTVGKGTGSATSNVSKTTRRGRDDVRDTGDDGGSGDRPSRLAVDKGCEEVLDTPRAKRAKRTKKPVAE